MGALEAWFDSGKAAVGLLGSLFFGVYAAGKLLNGYRGDRADNRRQIFCGLAVSGICNLGIGFAGRLWVIMILWALNGFAQSALWCNIISLVSHWFYPRQHANIAVWLSTSMVGGALAGWGVCGWLIRCLPWQWVFRLPGLTLLCFSACWLAFSKNRASDVGFSDICPLPASEVRMEAHRPLPASGSALQYGRIIIQIRSGTKGGRLTDGGLRIAQRLGSLRETAQLQDFAEPEVRKERLSEILGDAIHADCWA